MTEQSLQEALADAITDLALKKARYSDASRALAKLREVLPEPEYRSIADRRRWDRAREDVSDAQKERLRAKRRWNRLKMALDPSYVPATDKEIQEEYKSNAKEKVGAETPWFKKVMEAALANRPDFIDSGSFKSEFLESGHEEPESQTPLTDSELMEIRLGELRKEQEKDSE